MQKSTRTLKTLGSRKEINIRNLLFLTLILLPFIACTFYSTPAVLGQEKQQNYTSNNVLICQVMEYLESPIGSNMQQVFNICNYQNSIGYNQSIAELCFIFSGKGIDIISAFCDKAIPNRVSTPAAVVNEISDTLNSQNNTDNGLKVTIFDGISNFFSNAFNR